MPTPRRALLAFLVTLAACASAGTDDRDLATNPSLYQSPGYKSQLPPDRAVFVAPMLDQRRPPAIEAATGPSIVTHMPEGKWTRSLPVMIDEVLRKELGSSGVVAAVLPQARNDALVIKPTLVVGACGAQEHVAGRRSFAEIGIKIVVLGPADANGKRTPLHDHLYGHAQVSEIEMSPVPAPNLMGMTLRTTLAQLLAGIDQSNVARSGVPLDADK